MAIVAISEPPGPDGGGGETGGEVRAKAAFYRLADMKIAAARRLREGRRRRDLEMVTAGENYRISQLRTTPHPNVEGA